MKLLRSSLAILIAAGFSANAQTTATTATTDPVGFTTVNVRAKTGASAATTVIVLPMERASSYVGSSGGATFGLDGSGRSVITFASSLFTNNQFTGAGNQHYFRVTSGGNAGDFSTIISNTATSITLADNFNSVLSQSNSPTFEVNPYWTLATALPAGGGLTGGTSASVADTVTIYNTNFVGTPYYYNTSANQWRTGITGSDNVIIPPGSGLAIARKQNSAVAIVLPGSVPLGTSAVSVNGSTSGTATKYTIVGSAYPLASRTLKELNLYQTNATTGVVGGSSAATADTVTIYNPSTGVGTPYYYNTSTNQWRTGITPSDNVTIPEGAAVLITRKSGRSPFTWYIPQPLMNLQ